MTLLWDLPKGKILLKRLGHQIFSLQKEKGFQLEVWPCSELLCLLKFICGWCSMTRSNATDSCRHGIGCVVTTYSNTCDQTHTDLFWWQESPNSGYCSNLDCLNWSCEPWKFSNSHRPINAGLICFAMPEHQIKWRYYYPAVCNQIMHAPEMVIKNFKNGNLQQSKEWCPK